MVLGKREGGEKEKEKGGEKENRKGKGKVDKERERESVTLGDVASVVARGRNVGVLVGEKDVRSIFPCYSHKHTPLTPTKSSRKEKKLQSNKH